MAIANSPPRFHESRRASARLPLSFPIVIRGKDAAGKSFIEHTQTVVINRRGARALTKHSLILGERLDVAVPHLKRVSPATVAWSGGNQDESLEVGIDLGQPGDFWGVRFPDDPLTVPDRERSGEHSRTAGSLTPPEQAAGSETPKLTAVPDPKWVKSVPVTATPAPQSSAIPPEVLTENSDKISSAIQELTHTAIERSLGEVLPQLNRQAEASLSEMQRVLIEQTREHLHRVVEDAVGQLEVRATQVGARNQEVWEQTLQRLAQVSQERLEASLAEYQARLAASAAKVRRELARTLADLSGALDRD